MFRFRMPLVVVGALSALAIVGGAAAAGAGGVTGPAFYVDGELYRTVGTPTDLSNTGAPDHSFDTIYDIAQQTNVAEAAPGDRDFNGGRWRVEAVTFDDYDAAVATYGGDNGIFDTAEEVEAAIDAGVASTELVRSFECPVIPLPKGGPHS